jgi:nitrogen fixation protein
MTYRDRQKISQMPPKGSLLEGTDLLEISTIESGSYVTKSITGQEIIDAVAVGSNQDLESVTFYGNITPFDLIVQIENGISTISELFISTASIGANTFTSLLSSGALVLKSGAQSSQLKNTNVTNANVVLEFPNKATGSYTIATTADIPSLTGYIPYTGATQNADLGEYELKAGQLTLDVSPTGTAAVGTTRWNNSLGSSETTLKGGNVILKNGVDLVARVVNKVTPNQTLTKAGYKAVRVSGAQGQRLAIELAQANNDNNSADTIGLVTETIPTNQEGFIITVGQLEGVNTTGSLQGETWVDGDVLYLSPTIAGEITKVKPIGSGHIVVIGYVEYAHAINGKIYVKIMNGWELDELHNVYIDTGTLANNDALIYESSTQLWKNKTIATALGYTPANREILINAVTTNYTLVLSDNNKMVEVDSASAVTITIPTNTTAFPIGTQILISQYGAGQVTIVAAGGVTLRSSGGKTKTAAQYAICTLIKRTANIWYLAGDLTT